MLSKDQEELLERRLTDQVSERIQKRFQRRYGFILAVFAAIAGYFGYDTYWDVQSVTDQIDRLEVQLTSMNERLASVDASLVTAEKRLATAEERLDPVLEVAKQVETAQAAIKDLEAEISRLTNRQFNFVVESAADLYVAAQAKPNAVEFYVRAKQFGEDIGDLELLGFATLRLARVYSRLGAWEQARKQFTEAERLARERFVSAGPATKRQAFEDYINVLLVRAEEEDFRVGSQAALLTLENKALRLAREFGGSGDVARIYALMADVYSTGRNDVRSLKMASKYYGEAIQTYDEVTWNDDVFEIVAQLYYKLGRNYIAWHEQSSDQELVDKAVEALDQAIQFANAVGAYQELYNSYSQLSEVQHGMGAEDAALKSICRAADLGKQIDREPEATIATFARVTRGSPEAYRYETICGG